MTLVSVSTAVSLLNVTLVILLFELWCTGPDDSVAFGSHSKTVEIESLLQGFPIVFAVPSLHEVPSSNMTVVFLELKQSFSLHGRCPHVVQVVLTTGLLTSLRRASTSSIKSACVPKALWVMYTCIHLHATLNCNTEKGLLTLANADIYIELRW